MKKFWVMLIVLAMTFTMFGCSSNEQPAASNTTETTASEATEAAPASDAAETTEAAEVDWPTGTVQIVVPYKAGGMSDAHARIVANFLQKDLDSPAVVMNIDSGNGVVAYETVRNADPDGLTLLSTHAGFLCGYYLGNYDYKYEDFTVVSFMQDQGNNVFAVNADSPYNTLEEFVAAAKEKPGELLAGIINGNTTQFIFGALEKQAEIDLKLVEAGGETDRLAALQGGFLDIAVVSAKAAIEYEAAGKIKVLAAITDGEDPRYPTTASLGYDQVVWDVGMFILGPKDMDPALVDTINAELGKLLDDSESVEQISNLGGTAAHMNAQDSLARMQKRDEAIEGLADLLGINVR
jgi:tripartite-type tricarboxylate transporter receptor subunit TctC